MNKNKDIKYDYFIETGTLAAETTTAMVPYFEKVYTIELSHYYYMLNVEKYSQKYNSITFIEGDSSIELNKLLPVIDKPSIIFLDGHWSSGNTAKGLKDCPLIEEISSIMSNMKYNTIIIIDDYRLFGKGTLDSTCNEDWHNITKETILSLVKSRLITEYHLPSSIHPLDRWIIEISNKMKIALWNTYIHHCNYKSLTESCKQENIELVIYDTVEECRDSNAYIVICPSKFADPTLFHTNQKILYGPHLWVIPEGELLGELDPIYKNTYFNALSNWVADHCREFSPLKCKKIICPFGINTDEYNPSVSEKNGYFIYIKNRHPDDINYICNYMNYNYGSPPSYIFIYGRYDHNQYKKALDEVKFGVWVGCHESQGFAVEESLSFNVPLFVWNVTSMKQEYNNGYIYETYKDKQLKATSIPYWDSRCGEYFHDKEELDSTFNKFITNIDNYQPRQYILENLSYKVTLKKMINSILNE